MTEQAKQGAGADEKTPQPITVFLDTSALRREAMGGVSIKHLQWAVEKGAVRVIVPDLVLRELASGLAQDFKKWASTSPTAEARKALGWCASGSEHAAAGVVDHKALAPRVEASLVAGIGECMKRLRARVLPITQAATDAAWAMYFEGSGPVKQIKSRDDIPDAFIVAIAHEAQRTAAERIHVVVSDGPMRRGLPPDRFVLHDSIADFNRSAAVEAVVKQLGWSNAEAYTQWRKSALSLLADRHDKIRAGVGSSLFHALAGRIVSAEFFPSKGEEGRLSGDGSIERIEMRMDAMDDIGPDAIIVPATLHVVDAYVRLDIPRESTWENAADFFLVNEWDEVAHYVDAAGLFELSVEAVLRVDLVRFGDDVSTDWVIDYASIDSVTRITVKDPPWHAYLKAQAMVEALREGKKPQGS